MAIAFDNSVSNYEVAGVATNATQLTLSPFTISSQTNTLCLLRIFTFKRGGVGVGVPTSVSFTGTGTFQKIVNVTNQAEKMGFSLWAAYGIGGQTSKSITITCDATCEVIVGYVCTYKGAYQALPSTYYSTSTTASVGTIAVTHLDCDSTSLLASIPAIFRQGLSGSITISGDNGQATRLSSSQVTIDSGGSTDGIIAVFLADKTSPSAPQADSYTIPSNGNTYAGLLSVELKPDTWTPPTNPVDGTNFCPYVSQGQVRKMVTAISGLGHLEGETVKVQADGIPEDSQTYTVLSENLVPDLPNPAAVVHVGLGYGGKIKLLKSSDGNPQGTGQMKKRRIYDVGFRVFRSLGNFKIGLDEDNLDPVVLGDPTLPLLTQDLKKRPKTKWDENSQLHIIVDTPIPVFILAVITSAEVENP